MPTSTAAHTPLVAHASLLSRRLSARIQTWWRSLALSGFGAVAEALYPENDLGAPSWQEADMVHRAGALWDAMPPGARHTMEALYVGLELGGAALLPRFGRLSRQPLARRTALFQRLQKTPFFPARFVLEGAKSSSGMVYLSHPAVLRHLGVTKTTAHPADQHLAIPVRPDALRRLIIRSPGRASRSSGSERGS